MTRSKLKEVVEKGVVSCFDCIGAWITLLHIYFAEFILRLHILTF